MTGSFTPINTNQLNLEDLEQSVRSLIIQEIDRSEMNRDVIFNNQMERLAAQEEAMAVALHHATELGLLSDSDSNSGSNSDDESTNSGNDSDSDTSSVEDDPDVDDQIMTSPIAGRKRKADELDEPEDMAEETDSSRPIKKLRSFRDYDGTNAHSSARLRGGRAPRGSSSASKNNSSGKKSSGKKESVKKAPVKKAPVKKAPVKKAPVKKASVKKVSVKKGSANKGSADKTIKKGGSQIKKAPKLRQSIRIKAQKLALIFWRLAQTEAVTKVDFVEAAEEYLA